MAVILIVEDDESLLILLKTSLRQKFEILTAHDGSEALKTLETNPVDLVLSDLMMDRMDGFQLVKKIRENNRSLPIILLTARNDYDGKQKGFYVGADDYITKPFDMQELIWRINALLRRAGFSTSRKIEMGSFSIDLDTHEASNHGLMIELTNKEFSLLFELLSTPNRVLLKSQLFDRVWGPDFESDETTLRTHINTLRNKLAEVQEFEIRTIHGLGYKASLKPEQS